MGADSVYFYYGVRRTVAPNDDEQISQLEDESHPICKLAFAHKLSTTWGCLTDGADFFILIGHEFGRFGIEGIHERSIDEAQFAGIIESTKARLKEAGFNEPPAFYVQLQAQY